MVVESFQVNQFLPLNCFRPFFPDKFLNTLHFTFEIKFNNKVPFCQRFHCKRATSLSLYPRGLILLGHPGNQSPRDSILQLSFTRGARSFWRTKWLSPKHR